MANALPKFESVRPDYEFSSVVKTEGNENVNYMHVMANGYRLDSLQKRVEQHLKVTSKEDISLEWGNRDIRYSGRMLGVEYKVLLEYGACPTLDGGEEHNVEVRTPLMTEDRLSPLVAQEMRKYETEMTQHIAQIEQFIRER
ncbi:MAG: hypothetical protein WC533_01325 [Candidatus Pacearchaeota archaeon]